MQFHVCLSVLALNFKTSTTTKSASISSQVLSTLKAWKDPKFCKDRLGLDAPLGSIDRTKLNVKGSSLAAGHPFAATGGRIIATAAKLINQKGSGHVLVSICPRSGGAVLSVQDSF